MSKNKVTAVLGPKTQGKPSLQLTRFPFQSGMIASPRLLAREVYDKVIKKLTLQSSINYGEEKIIPLNAKYFRTVESCQ